MAGSAERQKAATEPVTTQTSKDATVPAPTSPARSDDSDGKPVRDKLKETRIDAQATSDPLPTSDQQMNDAPNGAAKAGEQSASNSDTDRGRIRRKRSREDFEDEVEGDNHPEKKHGKEERHHVRKRSRDIKDIESGAPLKPPTSAVATIEENDADESMPSPAKGTSKDTAAVPSTNNDMSPKNKRTRDQVEEAATPVEHAAKDSFTNGKPVSKTGDERDSKRPRDEDEAQPAAKAAATTAKVGSPFSESGHASDGLKIPATSGFANTSAVSPFASMSPKPQASKDTAPPAQTSDDKFKASGFGSLAKGPSGFGGLASSSTNTGFGAVSGNKLSSFGGSKSASATPATGFGALSGSTVSSFGGSTFGSSSGGGFGALGGNKPTLGSFGGASPSSDLTIKGLKTKATAFGTPGEDKDVESSDDDGEDDNDEKVSTEKERQSSLPLLSQQRKLFASPILTCTNLSTAHETGEEGERTAWTGRAKLYTMAGQGSTKGWKERGVGTFKLNVTLEEPKKARFVLRADGTHRLLLNAALTKQLVFGGDSSGEKPKDGRLLFNSPTASGELEMHLLKVSHTPKVFHERQQLTPSS